VVWRGVGDGLGKEGDVKHTGMPPSPFIRCRYCQGLYPFDSGHVDSPLGCTSPLLPACFSCNGSPHDSGITFSASQAQKLESGERARCVTCIASNATSRYLPLDPPKTLDEALEEAVSAGDPILVRKLLTQGANPNYVRQAHVKCGGVYYPACHADGAPMPEEDPEDEQPTTPLKAVGFRISDCTLGEGDLRGFKAVCDHLLAFGASPLPALRHMEHRYGAWSENEEMEKEQGEEEEEEKEKTRPGSKAWCFSAIFRTVYHSAQLASLEPLDRSGHGWGVHTGVTPLMRACSKGDVEGALEILGRVGGEAGVATLLQQRDSEGWSPLFWASFYDLPTLIPRLSSFQCESNPSTSSSTATTTTISLLETICAPPSGGAQGKEKEKVEEEEEEEEKGTANRDTPLHCAALVGSSGAVRALLACGAQVDAVSGGFTPLMLACREGHLDTVRELLEGGASVEGSRGGSSNASASASASGWTPLLLASCFSFSGVVRELLGRHPPPSLSPSTTPNGYTALHYAVRSWDPSIAAMLVAAGADERAVDAQGCTPQQATAVEEKERAGTAAADAAR
jgi:ankyrin repeat protein